MLSTNHTHLPENSNQQEKILLVLLPYWLPLIPPMGISTLKSFLRQHGYNLNTADANVEQKFRDIYDAYLDHLSRYIPGNKKGNFYNIVNEVLRNHMMAHINYEDEEEYIQLVKILVYQTFFSEIENHQVRELNKILDEFYVSLQEYFLELLEKQEPTVLGISVYGTTAAASLFAFRLTKEKYPQIKTVMGGGIFTGELSIGSPNCHYFLKNTPFIDKIIVGEGELLLLKYLKDELDESQKVFTIKDIDHKALDLASVDIPDFSDLELRYYPHLGSYTSRSCPFQCSFCSEVVIWGKYRKKDAKQIAKELHQLYDMYNYQLFLMADSILNPVITDLANELIKSDKSIYWDGYLRADRPVCDPENTMLWRQGGFYRARLGLESGSGHVLKLMGKKIMPDQIREAVLSLAYAGIKTTTYWVIGYPGETEEDFQQTLDLIEELKDHIYEADCNPLFYFLTGQVNSENWAQKNKSILLYPETAKDMLFMQTWILDGEPSREETFERLNRFSEHCEKIGIPNPYSLHDIYLADERWKILHKNAVPALVEFQQIREEGIGCIRENKHPKKIVLGKNIMQGDGDWGF
jgi:radical SAM superfamily enzyme YgiQ (UPF0313 family)